MSTLTVNVRTNGRRMNLGEAIEEARNRRHSSLEEGEELGSAISYAFIESREIWHLTFAVV